MLGYVARRLLQMIPILFLASLLTWAMSYALPGGPETAIGGITATPEQIDQIRARMGLDRPLVTQYFVWLGGVVQGDLGVSFTSGRPVLELLIDRIPATLQLALMSMLIGLIIAFPLGFIAAQYPKSWASKLTRLYESIGLAVPTFWLGLLLILLFALNLQILPAVSTYHSIWSDPAKALSSTILPACTIAVHVAAILSRFISASYMQVLEEDFVRTARTKGVAEHRVLIKHALRNALLPTVTIVGVQLGTFLGGTVVTEVVFNYPGLGRLIYSAITARDYALIQGAVLFIIVVFLCVNLVVDLVYGILDPRVRIRS